MSNRNFVSCIVCDKKFRIKNVEERKKKITKEMFQSDNDSKLKLCISVSRRDGRGKTKFKSKTRRCVCG